MSYVLDSSADEQQVKYAYVENRLNIFFVAARFFVPDGWKSLEGFRKCGFCRAQSYV